MRERERERETRFNGVCVDEYALLSLEFICGVRLASEGDVATLGEWKAQRLVKKPNKEVFWGKKNVEKKPRPRWPKKTREEELDDSTRHTFFLQPLSLCERAHVINNT